MAQIIVSSGQFTSGLILRAGDTEFVDQGTAIATTVTNGGLLSIAESVGSAIYVGSGGVAVQGYNASFDGVTVAAGGTLIESYAYRIGTSIFIDPKANVIDSGVVLVSGAAVTTKGPALTTVSGANVTEYVLTGGVISNAEILSGAMQYNHDGLATNTVIGAGGSQLNAGGSATDTTILSGGAQFVSAGADASQTTIENGGTQSVGYYGRVDHASIGGGGVQIVSYGVVTDTTIGSQGLQIVSGGTITSTVIEGGGTEIVTSNSNDNYGYLQISNTTIQSGGYMIVSSSYDAFVSATTVQSGGTLILLNGNAPAGTIVNPGGHVVSRGIVILSNNLVQTINSGMITGATLSAGEKQIVLKTMATSTAILSGAEQNVESGATTRFSLVESGAIETGGGTASGTVVQSGGTIDVGIDHKSVISGGGVERVVGTSYQTTVLDGAVQQVDASFGGASGTIISSGGTQFVTPQGRATYTVIESGGYQVIDASNVVSNTDIKRGGAQILLLGKTTIVNNTTLEAGAMVISTGVILLDNDAVLAARPSLAGDQVGAGEQEYVISNGLALSPTITNGGSLILLHSGVVSGGTVEAGGSATVVESGVVKGTTIAGGGSFSVTSGLVSGLTVSGLEAVAYTDNTTAFNTSISAGGTLVMFNGSDRGTAIHAGGVEEVQGYAHASAGKSIQATIYAGGVQIVSGGSATAAQVLSGGDQIVEKGGHIALTHLLEGGTIDLSTFTFVSGGTATLQPNDNLVIVEGSKTTTLSLAGTYTNETFHLSADSSGGTMVTLSAAQGMSVTIDPIVSPADGVTADAHGSIDYARLYQSTGGPWQDSLPDVDGKMPAPHPL